MVDIWNVETTGSDVGGEEDTLRGLLEPTKRTYQCLNDTAGDYIEARPTGRGSSVSVFAQVENEGAKL